MSDAIKLSGQRHRLALRLMIAALAALLAVALSACSLEQIHAPPTRDQIVRPPGPPLPLPDAQTDPLPEPPGKVGEDGFDPKQPIE